MDEDLSDDDEAELDKDYDGAATSALFVACLRRDWADIGRID